MSKVIWQKAAPPSCHPSQWQMGLSNLDLHPWLIDGVKVLRLTRHKRSFHRRSSKSISWLSDEKLNQTEQKQNMHPHQNILQHKINTKN